ncbi:MAG TPA: DsrE family protein [Anaeromyxobacteraceae bacterium]|nr:DsrE family protein [Anaeromyxobacteraceae bacterium]
MRSPSSRNDTFRQLAMAVAVSVLAAPTGCTGSRAPAALPPPKRDAPARLDVRGKIVTTYILFEVTHMLHTMRDGEILELVTSPFAAIEPDVLAWSRMTGQVLLKVERSDSLSRYYIEKAPWQFQRKRVAIVISDPGLEELLSPLGLALSAALTGAEVHVFFQGPAVHVLERGFRASLHGTFRWLFSRFARNGLAQIGHLPPDEKLSQLHELGARFYACGPSLEHFGVERRSLAFNDVIVSEYLTFIEQMRSADLALLVQ